MGTGTDAADLDWRSVCPLTSCLDVLGDRWSLLIVRDLIGHGTRTSSEFRASPEHVATNILAHRLRLLTSLGIIERTDPRRSSPQQRVPAPPSGAALRPALEELAKWSQTHLKP